jgi:hypothetical protein
LRSSRFWRFLPPFFASFGGDEKCPYDQRKEKNMKRLKQMFAALMTTTKGRVAIATASLVALFLIPASNAFATGEEAASGSAIAKDFVEPLTTKFTEALPFVIGFIVLVSAVAMVIKFVQSRGKSKTV